MTDFGSSLIKRIKVVASYRLVDFKIKEIYLIVSNINRKRARVRKIVIFGSYAVMTQNGLTKKAFRVQRKRISLHLLNEVNNT